MSITGAAEVHSLQSENSAYRARLATAENEIVSLRKMLERAYRFISPNYDPSELSHTAMAANIRRILDRTK